MADILGDGFTSEAFQTQQNVNPDNMNEFYLNKDQKISGYFNNYNLLDSTNATQVGCICNGIGVIISTPILDDNFGQSGTTKVFDLKGGVLRFLDQTVEYPETGSGTFPIVQAVYATYADDTITLGTLPANDGTKYYCVAEVTITPGNSGAPCTCTVLTAVKTLTQLQTNQTLSSPTYIALFNISSLNGTSFTVSVDKYCANNYNVSQQAYAQSAYLNRFYQQGRLSDSVNEPEGSNSEGGSANLYFIPGYDGNLISLYNEITQSWITQTFTAVIQAVNGTIDTETVYDVYVHSASSTTVALSFLAWSTNTTSPNRDVQNGRLIKNGDPTKLFIGIIYSPNGDNVYSWTGERYIWNMYNKIPLRLSATQIGVGNYNYSFTTVRPQNANTQDGEGRFSAIFDPTYPNIQIIWTGTLNSNDGNTTSGGRAGLGIDSITEYFETSDSGLIYTDYNIQGATTDANARNVPDNLTLPATWSYTNSSSDLVVGFHYFQKLENTQSNGAVEFKDVGMQATIMG